jgi:cytochrome c-type biogenesis protein CcmF
VNKKIYSATPVFIIKDRMVFSKEVYVDELGLKIAFMKINPENGKIDLSIAEKKDNRSEFIIMKAIIFPHINILWTGCVLLIIGSWVAIRKRIKEMRRVSKRTEVAA